MPVVVSYTLQPVAITVKAGSCGALMDFGV